MSVRRFSLINALLVLALAVPIFAAAVPRGVTFTDYALDFDRIATDTEGQPMASRVAAMKRHFEAVQPGLYSAHDEAALDRRWARAIEEYPQIRSRYLAVVNGFSANLATAVAHFRKVFPKFTPPMPIILAHELGVRDGGSDWVNGTKVMLFGADMITKLHDDNSLQPFMEHELFHLEHARHFADCDQYWCPLWQEGLATDAARIMTPGASDHQLVLDTPTPIRAAVDKSWSAALCRVAANFDATDAAAYGNAFTVDGRADDGLPARYGYYVGMRIAIEAQKALPFPALARLDDTAARPVVVHALGRLIAEAHAPCAAPQARGPITHQAPRPA